jgi:hypothetical protein
MKLASLAFCALLPLAACSRGSGATPTTTPAATTTAGPTGTLVDLQAGDRACYVVLRTDAGDQSIEGDFELCPGGARDASGFIGQAVVTSTEKASVLAASCQGDVDCGKSDQVDLVVTITAAPDTPAVESPY